MKKNRLNLVSVIVILLMIMVIIYSGFQILKSTVLHNEVTEEEKAPSKTIVKDGVAYFPKQDMTTILLMGIDNEGAMVSSGSYLNNGETDVNYVLMFDEAEEAFQVLSLNRDTMVSMPVLGLGGKRAGTQVAQLALSHTYGDGMESSCENTRETVSKLLKGTVIDYYIAFNMDAIGILTDAVGGVTVNVTDDFSLVDPSLGMGKVKLTGEQAVSFIRLRKDVGDQMNISRMKRQEEFIHGFLTALYEKMESGDSFIGHIYEKLSDYMVTDCSINVVSNLLEKYSGYELKEIVTPKGTNIKDEHMEFYLDEESFDQLVIDMFYREKN